ncbi:MAG: NAD(P)-dependent oxidoreductase [Candidatus Parabeggiatoa sp.]|nr:NAD(P)-dependent oxidoreductase [Candidatus Parabeggiatoa sp.]
MPPFNMKKRLKILVVEPICCEAIVSLKTQFDVCVDIKPDKKRLLELIANQEILILKSEVKLDKELISAAKNLKLVAIAGIGIDNISLDDLKKRGIAWFNVPYLSAKDVAEFTLGLTLSLARKISLADSLLRKNEWIRHELMGISLRGKQFGVIGYGEIGKETSALAKNFGMKVQVYTRDSETKQFEKSITPVSFYKLLRTSDIISIHLPLNDETNNLFSQKEFEWMKSTALFINTSRGKIVNEDALYYALKSKKISGAAVDVFQNEGQYNRLFELDNIVVTPHIAALTHEAQEKIGLQVVKKIFEFFRTHDKDCL